MPALPSLLAMLVTLGPATQIDAQEPTYRMSDYLPMVVGNSWTYYHRYFDFRLREDGSGPLNPWNYPDHEAARGAFTITILRTEVIDGNTYHVFSDMPSGGWPPAPPYFLAGKKLRWDGSNLLEHDGTSEISIFRFENPPTEDFDRYTYSIPQTRHGDTSVEAGSATFDPASQYFYMKGYTGPETEYHVFSRSLEFVSGRGMRGCQEHFGENDYPVFWNAAYLLRSDLYDPASGGTRDGATPTTVLDRAQCHAYDRNDVCSESSGTSTTSTSWGGVKERASD